MWCCLSAEFAGTRSTSSPCIPAPAPPAKSPLRQSPGGSPQLKQSSISVSRRHITKNSHDNSTPPIQYLLSRKDSSLIGHHHRAGLGKPNLRCESSVCHESWLHPY